MQSETANVTPRCRHLASSTKQRCLTSDWYRHLANCTRYMQCVWFKPVASITRKHDVIHKTGSTWHIALSSEEDQATATSNMYRKPGEIWTCGFWNMWADRQTNRHTDHNTLHPSREVNTATPSLQKYINSEVTEKKIENIMGLNRKNDANIASYACTWNECFLQQRYKHTSNIWLAIFN